MKKNIIKIIISFILIFFVFVGGYKVPFIKQKIQPSPKIDDLKPLPYGSQSYIKNDILYTTVAVVPLKNITKMTQDSDISVTIEYKYSNTHNGALIMSYNEYQRLFGVTNG